MTNTHVTCIKIVKIFVWSSSSLSIPSEAYKMPHIYAIHIRAISTATTTYYNLLHVIVWEAFFDSVRACFCNMNFQMMLVNKWQNTRVPITLLRTDTHMESCIHYHIKKKYPHTSRSNESKLNEQTNERRNVKCTIFMNKKIGTK